MRSPNIKDALNTAANAHDKCLFLRDVLKKADGITLDGATLRGLGHVFEDLMTDLESIEAALDPA
jgi:hypothetical protein